jgi:hypothetical protein
LRGAGAIPLASAVGLAVAADLRSALAVQFLRLSVSAVEALCRYWWAPPPTCERHVRSCATWSALIYLSLSMIRSSFAQITEGADAGAVLTISIATR